ncbi:MAG TPA: hypothetical protein VHB79_12215 [Polyangiaceae bacterium]|nr:hypothetical protein [Polyangiaceae bacterium]
MRCASLAWFALVSACSVYSSDLVDGESSSGFSSSGRGGSGAGAATGSAGKLAISGGGSDDTAAPGAGGEPSIDDPGTAGSGTTPNAGSSGDGTGGTSGSVGGSGLGGNAAGSGNGTAGGGTSSGGGSGGSAPGTGDLIDGFEDGDITLEQSGGRGGVWYLFDDGTVGTAGPTPFKCSALGGAPAALGAYAMHITATGFTSWGTGLGVDFRAGKKVYDASKYTGIRFWARVGAGKNTRHRLQLADATTDVAGGKCNAAADAPDGEKCDDHFGINETFTTVWTQYVVRFDELTQIGWGNAAPSIDKSALYGLQLTAKAKLEVDLWLDQIEFF